MTPSGSENASNENAEVQSPAPKDHFEVVEEVASQEAECSP